MIKKIALFFAAVSVAGYAAAADVTFDQRGDFQSLVQSAQESDNTPSVPSQTLPGYTFTMTTDHVVHAKGFIQKDLPAYYWHSFKTMKTAIPDKMDLRPNLTQVENQGNCGGCWAFSLTATHRDGFALAGNDPGRLSQEWLIDNSTEAAGCNGGYFDSAQDFVTPGGQPLYKACPYKQGSGKCAKNLAKAAHINNWFMLGDKSTGPTIRDIEAYMASTGKEISIGIAAAAGDWESYSGGIYNACTAGQLDHMINIVGWDNEGAQFDANGNLPPGVGVWILRNSWGASWGENGYMRTRMTDASGARCNNVAEEAAAFDLPTAQ
jgi:C1A family cysteine protease